MEFLFLKSKIGPGSQDVEDFNLFSLIISGEITVNDKCDQINK